MSYKLSPTSHLRPTNFRRSHPSALDWNAVLGILIMSAIIALTLYLIWNKANL